jgi:hypothetical protein
MRSAALALTFAAGCGGGDGLPPLVLNEFMADNVDALEDDQGAFSDWIEIYNAGDEPLSLDGFYLSDDLGDPTMAALPGSLDIEARGWLVLFATAGAVDAERHVAFALEADGESIVLSWSPEPGTVETLDTVSFGPQEPDLSFARAVDGDGEWGPEPEPTPGAPNG